MKDIDAFKREHALVPAEDGDFGPGVDDELDLRAEDDALVAAELEAEPDEDDEDEEEDEEQRREGGRRRRRGRRGGRGRRRERRPELEGTFDHGDEGYGLWLDPAVQDDPVYAEHWAGHRPVVVSVEPDRIVIRRAGEGAGDDDDEGDGDSDED